jgi:hypothetical protein
MSLLTSVQESQPGYPYYSNVSGGGGGGGAGSFTSLAVSGQSALTDVSATNLAVASTTTLGTLTSAPLGLVYSQRQTLSATSLSNINFTGISVLNGTYACTVRGADNLSLYSAMASVWGNVSRGPGQQVLLIADSSNVQADPSSALTFTPTDIGAGVYGWNPNFKSSVVNGGSNFTCTLSPNFG